MRNARKNGDGWLWGGSEKETQTEKNLKRMRQDGTKERGRTDEEGKVGDNQITLK